MREILIVMSAFSAYANRKAFCIHTQLSDGVRHTRHRKFLRVQISIQNLGFVLSHKVLFKVYP